MEDKKKYSLEAREGELTCNLHLVKLHTHRKVQYFLKVSALSHVTRTFKVTIYLC